MIQRVLVQCERRGINPVKNPELITYKRMRQFLSDCNFSSRFENTMKIMSIITRRSPVELSQEQRDKLIELFRIIQKPFNRFRGKRKNFLSYSYTMYKLCELLGYDDLLPYLPLLKAPANLLKADRIWKMICKECRFQYIDTDPCDPGK